MPNELTYLIDEPPPAPALPFGRPVSPAILEMEIIDLRAQLATAKQRVTNAELDKLRAETELRVANIRLKGFERLTADLSTRADELQSNLDKIMQPDMITKPAA